MVLLSLCCLSCWVSPPHTRDDVVRRSRAAVQAFVDESAVPGLSVAVWQHDELLWAEGFGLASVEHEVPVTTETRFRIGSISKSLTSAAVGLLVERGKLDLDAPIQTYVPSFPDKGHPISTRQLGGHLSGIPHYETEDYQNLVAYQSVVHALDKFKDRPLRFVPGERFGYSSFGYNLMSAVIEGAAGQPFLDFMDQRVIRPLEMTNTVADRYDAVIPNRTGFYEVDESEKLVVAPFTDNSDVYAGGGFLSTPTDLVRFGHGLMDGRLLQENTLDLLFTPMTTSDGTSTGYGFGWAVEVNERGETVVSHGGGHYGATAQLEINLDSGLIIAMTANLSSARLGGVFEEIRLLFSAERDLRDD